MSSDWKKKEVELRFDEPRFLEDVFAKKLVTISENSQINFGNLP